MSDPQPSTDTTLDRLEAAEELKLAGKHEEALVILEELLFEDPTNVSALEEVADNELSLGKFERARKAAKSVIAMDERSYTGHYILGFLDSQVEDWSKALKHLQRSNELKGNNPEILRCLGWALFSSGKRTQGVVTLERSLNLDDENSLTLCDLGVVYLQGKNFHKAKILFNRAIDLDPNNMRARECAKAVERLQRSTQEQLTGRKNK